MAAIEYVTATHGAKKSAMTSMALTASIVLQECSLQDHLSEKDGREMSMATFESLLKQRIEEFDARGAEEEKIEYLLRAVPFLKEYEAISTQGPNDNDNDHEDASHHPALPKTPTGTSLHGSLEEFVDIKDGEHSKRRDVLVRYLEEVEHIPVDVRKVGTDVQTECDACGGRVVIHQDESALVCQHCGLSRRYMECGMRSISYDEEVSRDTKSQFSYKRLTHLNQWIDALQAKENTTIPDEVIDAVRNEFKKHRMTSKSDITPGRVKMFLKKLNLSRWYEHTHNIVNTINGAPAVRLPQDLEDRLKAMFLQVQHPFEKHRPKERKNFLHYGYTLYKLCQLLGEDEYLPLFPLLKSNEKIRAQDAIWKAICEELQWEYIPTV
jgi:hypothetical protein